MRPYTIEIDLKCNESGTISKEDKYELYMLSKDEHIYKQTINIDYKDIANILLDGFIDGDSKYFMY